jgi:hypothetical protein
MTKGLVFVVVAVETRTDRRYKHLKNGETVAPWAIETVTLQTPWDDAEFNAGPEGKPVEFRAANVEGPYRSAEDEIRIIIVDPERQGRLKIGDRIDLLGRLA